MLRRALVGCPQAGPPWLKRSHLNRLCLKNSAIRQIQRRGTVQASGGTYITRPRTKTSSNSANKALTRTFLLPQMGKSSLRVAVSERLRRSGIRIVSIDLTSIGTQSTTAEQWYVSFLETVEHDLHLKTIALDWWESHHHLTPTTRFTRYLLDVSLAEVPAPARIVIFGRRNR